MKKANSTMSVTISTGITFASDDYLITQGSLILQTAAVLGTAESQAENIYGTLVSKLLLTKLIFRENCNASIVLCSLVASDESFLVFSILMSCTGKCQFFLQTGGSFFQQICAGNVLAFMENNTKIKNQGMFICFPET